MDNQNRWIKMIEEQSRSEMSVRKYCEENRLAISTFRYWQSKLRTGKKIDAFIPVKTPVGNISSEAANLVEFRIGADGRITIQINPDAGRRNV